MSEIKLTAEELKDQAAQMAKLQQGYEELFQGVSSELHNMNGNWSSLLANNFEGKINQAQQSFTAVQNMLAAGAQAATESAEGFGSVDQALAKQMQEDGGFFQSLLGPEAGLAAGIGAGFITDANGNVWVADTGDSKSKRPSQLEENYKLAKDVQKKIDKEWDKIPHKYQKALKTLYKYTIGEKLKGLDKAYKIWDKIANDEYSDAFSEFVGDVADGAEYITTEGGASLNWGGVYAHGIAFSIQAGLDFDGYAHKNTEKYLDDWATNYLRDGDVASCIASLTGGVIQAPIRGAVDGLCQIGSGVLDSAVSAMTGGMFTMSSINDALYEMTGDSPGRAFTRCANAIGKGVDAVIDKGLIKGAEYVDKGIKTSIKAVGSLIKKVF